MQTDILVDKNGYNEFFLELENLKKSLLLNASEGSKAYQDAVGDGWHDNFAFEQSMIKERNIANQIDKMLEDSKRLKIIENENENPDVIGVNCIIKIEFMYPNNNKEIDFVKLTGNYLPKLDSDIMEITLNSPLGKTLYKKRKNEKTFYIINEQKIDINILDIDNLH